jgi:hypothetical protein
VSVREQRRLAAIVAAEVVGYPARSWSSFLAVTTRRRRRRTVGRIEGGGGDGGDPVLSPPGWQSYANRVHAAPAARSRGMPSADAD